MAAVVLDTDAACRYVSAELAAAANQEKASGMQAYMKTEMPFYGVQKPARKMIMRRLKDEFAPSSLDEYESLVLALWDLPHREEKYLALAVGVESRQFHTPASLPLYRRLMVEGAWWDFVDEVSTRMVREVVRDYPEPAWAVVDQWIDDEVMWLRRSAIICQVGIKERTDADRLFSFCRQRAFEEEFFIRKAIGWALREYSKTNPEAVAAFAIEYREELSGLSFREATRHILDHIP
ncbi:MAG: DNA alkylation repair protein [Acidobacteria bacterium]|nr:DNA alkylation repair protein [Acidobacteriota bacterium]